MVNANDLYVLYECLILVRFSPKSIYNFQIVDKIIRYFSCDGIGGTLQQSLSTIDGAVGEKFSNINQGENRYDNAEIILDPDCALLLLFHFKRLERALLDRNADLVWEITDKLHNIPCEYIADSKKTLRQLTRYTEKTIKGTSFSDQKMAENPDLTDAKRLFFLNYGNRINMEKNGEYDIYKQFEVDRDTELNWSRDIARSLVSDVCKEFRLSDILDLVGLDLPDHELIDFFEQICSSGFSQNVANALKYCGAVIEKKELLNSILQTLTNKGIQPSGSFITRVDINKTDYPGVFAFDGMNTVLCSIGADDLSTVHVFDPVNFVNAFDCESISKAEQSDRIIQLDDFSSTLTARVVSREESVVSLGNIAIHLDKRIPDDVRDGEYIYFNVSRLDVKMGKSE